MMISYLWDGPRLDRMSFSAPPGTSMTLSAWPVLEMAKRDEAVRRMAAVHGIRSNSIRRSASVNTRSSSRHAWAGKAALRVFCCGWWARRVRCCARTEKMWHPALLTFLTLGSTLQIHSPSGKQPVLENLSKVHPSKSVYQ